MTSRRIDVEPRVVIVGASAGGVTALGDLAAAVDAHLLPACPSSFIYPRRHRACSEDPLPVRPARGGDVVVIETGLPVERLAFPPTVRPITKRC